jgi:4-amino-4-deoxy-L-arabinose transferase-like glycosyltransferase
MPVRVKISLIILVLAGVLLRYHGFLFNSFHPDEALFAYWSRLIAVGRDPLLANQLVDKPPLLFYLQALFYPLFGPVEWAARVPNFAASVMLIPATGLLAWHLFRQELSAVLAAAFIAFSPLAIQFSGTAFTDPLLTFWLTLSLVAVGFSAGRRFMAADGGSRISIKATDQNALFAGIFFGLAVATKFQAWLFLPLVIGLAFVGLWKWGQWKLWLTGFLVFLALVVIWELLRIGSLTLVSEQLSSFGGLRFSFSWELWPRLEAWARQWRYVLDSEILSFLVVFSLPLYLALLIHDEDRATVIDQMLALFLIGYFVLHWFLAIPVWDRYLLPLLPLVGIVLARFVLRIVSTILVELPAIERYRPIINRTIWLIPLILLVFQGQGVRDAYAGRLPIGGQPEADQGISKIVEELNNAPYGSVLYDHWFSWQLRYYLFENRIYISWFPNYQSLQEDLLVFGRDGNPRYLLVPDNVVSGPIIRAIYESGFYLTEVDKVSSNLQGSRLALYLIEPR